MQRVPRPIGGERKPDMPWMRRIEAGMKISPMTLAGILMSHIVYGGLVGLVYAGFALYA